MKKVNTKILIITGGISSERKISLISSKAVKEALQANGHSVKLFDFKKGYSALKNQLLKYDLVFPVMHGEEGEDGKLYKFLREHKKPYVGSDPKGAQIAFNKILFKKYCNKNNIATAQWKIITNSKAIKQFGFPCVLKGSCGGSSHEVILLHAENDLRNSKVKKILELKHGCFVEKLLIGPEVTVGILCGKSLPILEIVPPKGQWFDYKNKYSGKTKEIPSPRSVSHSLQRKSQKIALDIHSKLNLGSFSRTDFIIENNIPYVIETNTPGGVGLTPISLFPKAAKVAGISFNQLVERLINK